MQRVTEIIIGYFIAFTIIVASLPALIIALFWFIIIYIYAKKKTNVVQ